MEISAVRDDIKENRFCITDHAFEEMRVDGFILDDISEGIMAGKIIEEYPVAYPLPACLINARTRKNRPIHICVSLPPLVKIITVYEPSIKKWEDDFSKRREVR